MIAAAAAGGLPGGVEKAAAVLVALPAAGVLAAPSARAFSPTIIPSYTSVPGPTKSVPRSCRLASA